MQKISYTLEENCAKLENYNANEARNLQRLCDLKIFLHFLQVFRLVLSKPEELVL